MNVSLISKALELSKTKPLAGIRTETGRRRFNDNGDFLLPDELFGDDCVKIINSKAFRRLSRKTQVTSFPINHHIRNRQSHTMEVFAVNKTLAKRLGLNVELAQAIALGHDIGHVPLGHPGETFLAEHTNRRFTHEVMSVVIAQHIERNGMGVNLTHETLDGIEKHSGENGSLPTTPEGMINRIGDKVGFIFSDYNDFRRFGFKFNPELIRLMEKFGENQRERVAYTNAAIIVESAEKGRVEFRDSEVAKDFVKLRTLMYEAYPRITSQDPRRVMEHVFDFVEKAKIGDPLLIIALMTDTDIEYLSSKPMLNFSHIRNTAVGEILDNLPELDCCDPDLNW